MQTCPQHHLKGGKICRECGYLYPLEPGQAFGALEIIRVISRSQRAYLYHCRHDNQDYALWEAFEIFKPDYREHMVTQLGENPLPGLPEIRNFSIDDMPTESSLVYLLYDWEAFQNKQTLDVLIREQGIPTPETSYHLILNLLEILQELEARKWVWNTFHSHYLYVDLEQQQVFPGQAVYAQELRPGALSPHIFKGFSPPEQIRSGEVFHETDRFGLAMTLVHLLTGLSPVLWSPDLPRLHRYQYLWGKKLVQFYEQLMQPVSQVPASVLLNSWKTLQPELLVRKITPSLQEELRIFYAGLAAYENHDLNTALDYWLSIQRPQLHNPHVPAYIARALWQKQLKREAFAWYGEAIRRESLGVFYQEAGEWYEAENQTERAEQAFRRALERIPYVPDPYNGLGRCAKNRKNFKTAKLCFEKSLQIHPTWHAKEMLNEITEQQFPMLHQSKKQLRTPTRASLEIKNGPSLSEQLEQSKQLGPYRLKQVGETLGNYTLEAILRERDLVKGNRSSIYLMTDAQAQRFFVKEVFLDASGRGTFYKERYLLQNLDHPAIPPLIESFEHEDCAYLVQPYLECPSLDSYLNTQGLLPESEIRLIFEQGLKLIVYLQNKQIIHADIKPENLHWDAPNQTLYLIDFDIAVEYKLNQPRNNFSVGVTVDFAAPEQVDMKSVNMTTDVFALALTCLNLATGLSSKLFYRHQKQAYASCAKLPQLSRSFGKFLDQLLTCNIKKRAQHYTHAAMLLPTLENVLASPPKPLSETQRQIGLFVREIAVCREAETLEQIAPKLKALSQDPKIDYLLAFAHLAQQNWEQAWLAFDQAMAKDPQWLLPYYGKSAALADQGQSSNAIALLKKSLDYCKTEGLPYALMAKCFVQQEQFKPALQLYQKALKLEPHNKQLCLDAAHLYIRLGAFESARKLCHQALKYAPTSARAFQLLQMICGIQENYPAAIEYGERAAMLRPHRLNVQYDLGFSYFRAGYYLKAMKQFQKCLKLDPEHVQSLYYLADCLLEMKRPEEARSYFLKVRSHIELQQAVKRKLALIDSATHKGNDAA